MDKQLDIFYPNEAATSTIQEMRNIEKDQVAKITNSQKVLVSLIVISKAFKTSLDPQAAGIVKEIIAERIALDETRGKLQTLEAFASNMSRDPNGFDAKNVAAEAADLISKGLDSARSKK